MNKNVKVYVCITCGNCYHFRLKMVTISARKYKHIQNMQTSQGYIFRILQHFVTKFCNFTNFGKFFRGNYFFLPR
jgi:p-aminobenzoyl-glutamate transporter AbgT